MRRNSPQYIKAARARLRTASRSGYWQWRGQDGKPVELRLRGTTGAVHSAA